MNPLDILHALDPRYMLLTNLYWLLFLIPGYSIWRHLKSKGIYHQNDQLASGFIFSVFYSAVLLLPFNILQFFATIPSIIPTLYFSFIVVLGIYYLIKTKDFIIQPKTIIAEIRKRKSTIGIFLIVLFGSYFLIGQIIKALALYEFDAWLHISKINFEMINGLSNIDPYFNIPGAQVIQSNFSSNLVHTLFVVPAKIFSFLKVSPFFIWEYSISFFSLFSYSVVYSFIKKLTANKNLSIFVLLIYFFSTFATQNQWLAQYPTRLAFMFMLISLIFLVDAIWSKKESIFNYAFVGFLVGLLGVSFLHQIIACLLILFSAGFFVVLWLFREIKLKKLAVYSAALLIGLPTSIYTKIYSKYMPTQIFKLADSDDWIIRLSSKFSMTKFPDQALTATFLITIIGVIVLSLIIKEKRIRLFLIYSVFFVNLLLYSPMFGLVNQFIPTWGIVRIDYFVVILNWLLIGIPLWLLLDFVFAKTNPEYKTRVGTYALVIFMLALPAQKDIKLFYDVSAWNQGSYQYVKELLKWEKTIKPKAIILTDKSLSYSIPGIFNNYSAVLDNERTTDSIDTTERANDLIDFFYSKKSAIEKKKLIEKYNIKYLIVRKKDQEKFKDNEAETLNFQLIGTQPSYKLYEKD